MLRIQFWTALTLLLGTLACRRPEEAQGLLRYNESESVRSLDPVQAFKRAHIWITRLWAETLFEVDSAGDVVPALCQGYRWSAGRDTLWMGVRAGVYFHKDPCFGPDSTRALRPEDVVFALRRAAHHPASTWIFSPVRRDSAGHPDIRLVRDSVEIALKRPQISFLKQLANPQTAIVPQEWVLHYGAAAARHPVGTGPFRFVAWHPEEMLLFRRQENHWKNAKDGSAGMPPQGVLIRLMRDRQTEILRFVQGDLDFMAGNDRSYAVFFLDQKGRLKEPYSGKIRLEKGPVLNTEYLAFHLERPCPPCQSRTLRRTIAALLDKTYLTDVALEGLGEPAHTSMVPPALRAYALPPAPPPSTERCTLRLMTTGPYSLQAALVKDMLERQGFTVTVGLSDAATHKTAVALGEYDFFRGSWIADFPDAENYFSLFYSGNRAPDGPNYSRFKNPVYDALFEQLCATEQPDARQALCARLDSLLTEEMPVIPLYYDVQLRFLGSRVVALPFDVSGHPDFSRARIRD